MTRKVGVFNNSDEAIQAIRQLQALGFTNEEISVVSRDAAMKDYVAEENLEEMGTSATTTGAVTGGVIGGLGALLIELGLIAIPGIGPFLAVGPVGAALVGALAGGTVGGVLGALVDLGFEEDEARFYDEQFQQGRILVMVEDDGTKTMDLDKIIEPYSLYEVRSPRSVGSQTEPDDTREKRIADGTYVRDAEQVDRYLGERWHELREDTNQRWDRLTEEDLNIISGKREKLHDRLKHHYGWDDAMTEREILDYYGDQIHTARYNEQKWGHLD